MNPSQAKNQALPKIRLDGSQQPPGDVLEHVHRYLEKHFVFHCHLASLRFDYQNGRLFLAGQLPSFYLKQLLQTALKQIPGVNQIVNRVNVVSNAYLDQNVGTRHQSS